MNTNALKAAAYTALFTFIATFCISALDWLQDVAAWASTSGAEPLPGLSVLGYAAVSALVAASSGVVNYVIRAAQSAGVLPGSGPSYPTTLEG